MGAIYQINKICRLTEIGVELRLREMGKKLGVVIENIYHKSVPIKVCVMTMYRHAVKEVL